MTASKDIALLPAGLQDLLAPDAAHEARVAERLIDCFTAHGYDRVKPPLLEFEEALLVGTGSAVARQTFRVMDPVSQRMMGLRADITPQVARIAASRLRAAPRPLRLCYGGEVLRVKGTQLSPERQLGQVGVEMIGAAGEAADAEVVLLAAEALGQVGVEKLSVDLTVPPLVGAMAAGLGFDDATVDVLRQVLDRKDVAALAPAAGSHAPAFEALLRAAGPARRALEILGALDLSAEAGAAVKRLESVVALITGSDPQLTLTVDPVEHRGFEYHTGISFTVFARDVRGELGRGGRYLAEHSAGLREASTGFTLDLGAIRRALPAPEPRPRLFVPVGVDGARAGALRAEGWITVAGLEPTAEARSEARRMGCSHVLLEGGVAAADDEG